MYYLYFLYSENEVMYVGITHDLQKRMNEHKRRKKPHYFCVIDEYTSLDKALADEVRHIAEHSTYTLFWKWNKSPGGEYAGSTIGSRKGIGGRKKGGIPWNKGLTSDDPRVRNNVTLSAITRKANGFYDDCSKYLIRPSGDSHYMKRDENRQKMSELARRRFKTIKEDGTWTWGYRPL